MRRNLTNTEIQRAYKEKMYAAGYKQVQLWVLRENPKKHAKVSRDKFFREVERLTAGWDEKRLTALLALLLQVIKSRKGVKKQ